MKRYLLLALCIVLFSQILTAQNLTHGKQYIFPEFMRANVYYKEGSGSKFDVNYNLLTDEMQYINDKDKKVSFNDFTKIDYIGVGLRHFIPLDYDFAEIVVDNDNVSLAVKRMTKVSGASRGKINKILDRNEMIPENVELVSDSVYYLIRMTKPEGVKKGVFKGMALSQDRVVLASYSGFRKVFSKHLDKLNEFIKNESIDLEIPADIVRLINFCNSL